MYLDSRLCCPLGCTTSFSSSSPIHAFVLKQQQKMKTFLPSTFHIVGIHRQTPSSYN